MWTFVAELRQPQVMRKELEKKNIVKKMDFVFKEEHLVVFQCELIKSSKIGAVPIRKILIVDSWYLFAAPWLLFTFTWVGIDHPGW